MAVVLLERLLLHQGWCQTDVPIIVATTIADIAGSEINESQWPRMSRLHLFITTAHAVLLAFILRPAGAQLLRPCKRSAGVLHGGRDVLLPADVSVAPLAG